MDDSRAAGGDGLSLAPVRGLRPTADGDALARALCPPYDVIDSAERAQLLAGDPDNAVAVILPSASDGLDAYSSADRRLDGWVTSGRLRVDREAALYVYEMSDAATTTRGLLGAVQLREPTDGVILPHEDTMPGPVADRLALMSATEANLEPIYLVYDGGGAATEIVASVAADAPLAQATTPDGLTHRLWSLSDPSVHRAVAADLAGRSALIADGHHRYATYLELQRQRAADGPGPWDRGLALLVDTGRYGPSIAAIHRVLVAVPMQRALAQARSQTQTVMFDTVAEALARADPVDGFAAVITDGEQVALLSDPSGSLAAAADGFGGTAALTQLDVSVLHRVLIEQVWQLDDREDTVEYAHSTDQALAAARESHGTAILLRPTPTAALASVAGAGERMPRKSTLITPKPASGLVMRRFADER
jgi:uncharacterized protein (DUF1015 family)